jgi:hypothetical protein
MSVLVVRNAALLRNRDLLVAARHSAAPRVPVDLTGEVDATGRGVGHFDCVVSTWY